MFCRYCGKEIRNDAAFCPACGRKLPVVAIRPVAQEDGRTGTNAAEQQRRQVNAGVQAEQQDRKVNPDVQAYDHQPEAAEQAGTDWKKNLLKGKLLCPECGGENLLEAKYCFSCGRQFTEKEQQDAYNHTIYGKIEKVGTIKSIADGSIITGNIWFRIAVLVIIAAVGVWGLYKNGSNFRIAESESYEVQYNTEEKEYYLFTDQDSINVSLYVPKNTEQLELTAVNTVTDEVLETKTYSIEQAIALYPDSEVKYLVSTGKRELTFYALRK